jgi:LuxR family maltose regulon positive regulatory protein
MERNLLAIKVRIPRAARNVVHRDRLLNVLEQGIWKHKVTVLAAPAGYGKTTLLAEWARTSRRPVAWLSLDEDDNDPERFLRYLLMGWEAVQSYVAGSPLGLLLSSAAIERESALAAFINTVGESSEHVAFVFDDCHLLSDSAIHQALTFLLDHLPPTAHFVLATRARPPLPLPRYRARGELLELHTSDLQFLPDETANYFRQQMGLALTDQEIATAHSRLEGWVAGLYLVGLSHQQSLEVAQKLAVSGQQAFIADYLSEDVLSRLPVEVCHFLLSTSILDQLCGPLVDAVTQGENGQTTLETLERNNVFLVSLDDQREWYRYHQLFAEFLRGELARRHPKKVASLHGHAARWYLANDLPEPAFRHAVACHDAKLVADILERYASEKLVSGEVLVLERWLSMLPEAWRATYRQFDLLEASILIHKGQVEQGLRLLERVEQWANTQGEEQRAQVARIEAMRCFVACHQHDLASAQVHADRALRDLPATDAVMRLSVYGSLGDSYRLSGRWEEARSYYLKSVDSANSPISHAQSAASYGALADLDLQQGRLQAAHTKWQKALEVIQEPESWGKLPLPLSGWVHIRLGEILYEWDDLDEARKHLNKGLERSGLGGDVRALLAGALLGTRLELVVGDIAAATEHTEWVRKKMDPPAFPSWRGQFERLCVECWLATGNLRKATEWANALEADGDLAERPEFETTQLAMARALSFTGDAPSLNRARILLKQVLRTAQVDGRMRAHIDGLALLALVCSRQGDQVEALIAIERALRLAEPEGYVRLFTDYGLPMAQVLQAALSREIMPDYVSRLLGTFGSIVTVRSLTARALPQPLSGRERDVLCHLAAGLTNREIADALTVSPETVKKHTSSIYVKLHVSNRTEAAAQARELHLLD